MKPFTRIAFLIACLPMGTAIAGDFDGSKPLICAPIEARACVSGQACVTRLPADLGMPAFLRIDVANKTITGPKRTTLIRAMEQGEDALLLMGSELGLAWSIAVNSADGTMSGTLTDGDIVAVLFGSCTPL